MKIEPFTGNHLDEAANLLASSFLRLRKKTPSLSTKFDQRKLTKGYLEKILHNGALGAVGLENGRLLGYLLGEPREDAYFGRSVWVRLAGHALEETADQEIYRHLYTTAGAEWVARGYFNHYVQVPAVDEAALWTWFGLGFGQQQVHACLDIKAYSHNNNTVRQDLTVRRASPGDEEILASFSGTIAVYQTGAPVWAPMAAGELEELRQGYAELASDKEAITWLAFEGDQAVGMQVYFPTTSGFKNPLVADNAIELKVGSTHPQARGKGIASALTKYALLDARERGYAWCLIDWRSTNLLSTSFWPRLGFEPVAYRLERRVDERVAWKSSKLD